MSAILKTISRNKATHNWSAVLINDSTVIKFKGKKIGSLIELISNIPGFMSLSEDIICEAISIYGKIFNLEEDAIQYIQESDKYKSLLRSDFKNMDLRIVSDLIKLNKIELVPV